LKNKYLTCNRLAGNKIIFYPFQKTDINSDYIAWLNDPEIMKYSNQRFVHHTFKSCLKYWESFEESENIFLKIVEKNQGVAIGTMTLYVQPAHGTVDLGIMIGCKRHHGKGIGYDSWSTMMQWLLQEAGIRKVTGGTMRANLPMLHIMEKSGMTLEAVRPGQEILDGKPQDLLFFGKFS